MIDKLIEEIDKKKNPTVVGLDPTVAMMPPELIEKYSINEIGEVPEKVCRMFLEFNKNIINEIAEIVPAVKPQIAMYEKYGKEGIECYDETCKYAKEAGLVVIGDIKRGDISSTAACYAAHLGGIELKDGYMDTWHEDFVTINPYMGSDGIKPFLDLSTRQKKGIFVLLKTSNPSSSEIQNLKLSDGCFLFEAVGSLVEKWGREFIGSHGYSRVGAVVGGTNKKEGEALRKALPHTFFLVPGFGVQGATAKDVAGFFDAKKSGAIINSSRGITAAFKKQEFLGKLNYSAAARKSAEKMRDELRAAIYESRL